MTYGFHEVRKTGKERKMGFWHYQKNYYSHNYFYLWWKGTLTAHHWENAKLVQWKSFSIVKFKKKSSWMISNWPQTFFFLK